MLWPQGPASLGPQPDPGGPHGYHVPIHSRCHSQALDLRQYDSWWKQNHIRLFQARRADIECFARDLEARGRARATITRRLCTIAGLYKDTVEEELLDHSPAAHVRRPRLDYESHATGLDRNELGALLVAAGSSSLPVCLDGSGYKHQQESARSPAVRGARGSFDARVSRPHRSGRSGHLA